MSEQICIGRCNSRFRRLMDDYEKALTAYHRDVERWQAGDDIPEPERPEEPRVRPWYGSPTWCGTCAAEIRKSLAELDDLAALSFAASDGHREPTLEGHVSGSANPPSLPSAVDDIDELESWLRDWKATATGNDSWARQGGLATAVTTGVAWLLFHLDAILAREFAADFGKEVLDWHHRLSRSAKAGVEVQRKSLRCPSCRMATLEWKVGEDRVRCAARDCQRALTLEEYDAEVEKVTEQEAS